MFPCRFITVSSRLVLMMFLSPVWQPVIIRAQTDESIAKCKQKAADLTKQQKYTEALPILEKLAIAEPSNAETRFYLDFEEYALRACELVLCGDQRVGRITRGSWKRAAENLP